MQTKLCKLKKSEIIEITKSMYLDLRLKIINNQCQMSDIYGEEEIGLLNDFLREVFEIGIDELIIDEYGK